MTFRQHGDVAVALFTDGREYVFDEERIRSWTPLVTDPLVDSRYVFDDSGDWEFHDRLMDTFGPYGWHVLSWPRRRGFAGTVRSAWQYLWLVSSAPYVLHLEDDFVLVDGDLTLARWLRALDGHGWLANMALLRQPWNTEEIAAGGVMRVRPADWFTSGDGRDTWTEHRVCFTTNPTLYRASLLPGWPDVDADSEGLFTHRLLEEGTPECPTAKQLRFAYLGAADDPPRVEHIGVQRIGTGY